MANTVEITKSNGKKLVMEIKSCPFCGDEDVFVAKRYVDGLWQGWEIVCPNCDLVVFSQDHNNKRNLIKEWNRRIVMAEERIWIDYPLPKNSGAIEARRCTTMTLQEAIRKMCDAYFKAKDKGAMESERVVAALNALLDTPTLEERVEEITKNNPGISDYDEFYKALREGK